MTKLLKNPFKYFLMVAQLIAAVDAFYDTVTSLDDDPEVQAKWQELKSDVVIATRVATLRMQVEMIVAMVKQLKK